MKLIDADKLMPTLRLIQEAEHQIYGKESWGFASKCINTIEDAPTIEERNTGHWVKVHGFVTPGGDPVWACSECGKGIHVYGIEHGTYGADVSDGQWKACPNCGAVMRSKDD